MTTSYNRWNATVLFTILCTIGFVVFMVISMSGMMMASTDRYFCSSGSSGNWGDLGNWYETYSGGTCSVAATSLPTAESKVTITAGKTCNVNVSNAVADRIIVESTATLNIEAGTSTSTRLLELDGSTSNVSTVNGTVNLQGAYSKLKFKDTSQNIEGSGNIVGLDNAAEILISSGETLTNKTKISGTLKIVAEAGGLTTTFRNEGTVHANTPGTLLLNTDAISDSLGSLWKVSNSVSAVLQWNPTDTAIPELFGDFEVLKGTLDVDGVGFMTTGTLLFTEGVIDVDPVNNSRVAEFGVDDY